MRVNHQLQLAVIVRVSGLAFLWRYTWNYMCCHGPLLKSHNAINSVASLLQNPFFPGRC